MHKDEVFDKGKCMSGNTKTSNGVHSYMAMKQMIA